MKRTLIEVVLALTLVGASIFGWLNWQQNLSSKAQLTALQAASDEAGQAIQASGAAAKAAEEKIVALQEQMTPMQMQQQELMAVKAALANGTTLSDLEAAYKAQKNLSAERQVGLGALRMLTKGSNDPAALDAFRKAIQLSDLGSRKNTICAAQIGLTVGGEKIALMPECQPPGKPGQPAPTTAPTDPHHKTVKKAAAHAATHWSYDGEMGPERWGKEFPTCSKGKSQAPLDIRGPFVKTRTSVSADYKEGPLKILNNGHTIQVNVPPGSKLRVDSVPHELLQFHFHRPSEEKIEGKAMAMVLHFVHKNAAGKLVVLGVLLKEGNENPGIKTLWDNLPRAEGSEFSPEGVRFNPGNLLPREFDFYSYEGSLTTPPCTEDISYIILKTPINVSAEQVNQFPFKHNARPVQPRNGREIVLN